MKTAHDTDGRHVSVLRSVRGLFMAALLAPIAGCGTVIVDYAIEAQVSGLDAAGHAWRARADEITVLPRPPKILTPFDAVRYRGPVFEWVFGTGTLGFGGHITNRTPGRLCFRFDQARMSSNMHPGETPFAVYNVSRLVDGRWTTSGSTDPRKRQDFVPPAICLDPGQSTHVQFGPDLRELFPTQKMFNVRWPDDEPNLIDRGVGNWIRISLPIEYESNNETIEVKLTATDSKARISYY